MIKRALLTGLGESYHESLGQLAGLDAKNDIKRISGRLRLQAWTSIDCIDDTHFNFYNLNTQNENHDALSLPTADIILKACTEILNNPTDIFLFYYSGHAFRFNHKLYLLTYNSTFFQKPDLKEVASGKFITDVDYIDFTDKHLQANPHLTIISIFDCCYAGTVVERLRQTSLSNRHLVFCAVDQYHQARGPSNSASFFTGNLCDSAEHAFTYAELKNLVNRKSASFSVSLEIPNTYLSTTHPL